MYELASPVSLCVMAAAFHVTERFALSYSPTVPPDAASDDDALTKVSPAPSVSVTAPAARSAVVDMFTRTTL